ncbi:Kiwa anti-phage protein KwaB-like domain-containing protein [Nocardiopsis dassonvillei]|uniref:Kiwa anti-phage protein KwaB-like domain-containing protein n=1 Tax=Nocardiopsis dassonvillei TaxID=2014 RepID=UPI0036708F74
MAGEITTEGAATLIVAWRRTRHVHGRMLRFGGEFGSKLREYAEASVEKINVGSGKSYDPDDEQGEADFLTVKHEELQDTEVVSVLRQGASLQNATADELRKKTLAFYALILGDEPENRSVFIKAGNPIKLAGKSLVGVFDNTLTRIHQPLFQFEASWDVIITNDGIWAFDQNRFERLFKETDVVLAKTDEWVEKLAAKVPIAEDDLAEFSKRLRSNSVLRRKVTSILQKPHLESLTADALRKKMSDRGLDPEVLMPNGSLSLTKETQSDVLRLLNEDLFTGDFSGEQYSASRKSLRR